MVENHKSVAAKWLLMLQPNKIKLIYLKWL